MSDYVEFMRETSERLARERYDPVLCPDCGGTGIEAVGCCGGQDCGCMGQPVDYRVCPRGCCPPDWFISGLGHGRQVG